MPQKIVASVRMSHAGIAEGTGGRYLARARALTSRAEAMGATLVAWSATTFSVAWDVDGIDDAVAFCVSLNDDAPTEEQAWASGMAEGELDVLSPTGVRAELAWGPALVCAVSLARIARPGETLVDGDVRAMRTGELCNVGTRASTDAGKRVRGWRLDLKRPWRRPSSARLPRVVAPGSAAPPDPDGTEPFSVPMIERLERTVEDLDTTDERPLPSFPLDPLDMVENTAEIQRPTIPDVRPPAPAHEPSPSMLPVVMPMDYANGDAPTATALPAPAVPAAALPPAKPPILSLVALRRAKARAEDAPANVRCHAALALAVALAKANRPEDALLEALDALARAREAQEPRAEEACLAFLAKLARTMGMNAAAEELLAGGTASPGRR